MDLQAPISNKSKPTKYITPDQPFPIQMIDTWVQAPMGFGSVQSGFRKVTLSELKQLFDFSLTQQRWTIKRSTFPIMPPSLLNILLRHAF